MLLVMAPYLPRVHVDVVQRCAVLCAVPATPLAALPFFIRSMHRSKSSPHQCALPLTSATNPLAYHVLPSSSAVCSPHGSAMLVQPAAESGNQS